MSQAGCRVVWNLPLWFLNFPRENIFFPVDLLWCQPCFSVLSLYLFCCLWMQYLVNWATFICSTRNYLHRETMYLLKNKPRGLHANSSSGFIFLDAWCRLDSNSFLRMLSMTSGKPGIPGCCWEPSPAGLHFLALLQVQYLFFGGRTRDDDFFPLIVQMFPL